MVARKTVNLLAAAVALSIAALTAQSPRVAPFDLDEVTIAELQRRMETGAETSRSIVEKYLARIDAIDRRGPAIRSVLEINPDAGGSPTGSTPNAVPAAFAGRSTASRSSSRTTSRPPIA